MPISFYHQGQSFYFPQKKVKSWLLVIAYMEHYEVDSISYVFTDDAFLLAMNKQYLDHLTYTDIITFDYSVNNTLNAEMYISVERVIENSKNYSASFLDEMLRVLIHGILHCIGYNDKTENDKTGMRKKEDECLQIFKELS